MANSAKIEYKCLAPEKTEMYKREEKRSDIYF